ncbi:hypothetical protein [Oceanobacillus halotolerans]|uniref:hypothetical protein n=1 Tax=Oceanobacillus halotolerans TaxID=2663380 RepID=UPI0013DB63D2|nr:hypothetical protein [Oceanobacillus halotolerans]
MGVEMQKSQDQAQTLRELFEEVSDTQTKGKVDQSKRNKNVGNDDDVDILTLPPRKEVHHTSKQRLKLKWRKPYIRLFFVMIVMTAIVLAYLLMYEYV